MLVGVLSDSHDNLANIERAARILRDSGVELVIHLGDIVAPFTLLRLLEVLRGVRVEAVYGNNCGEKMGLQKIASMYGANLADSPRILEVAGRRILLLHGWGSKELTDEVARALVESGRWDAVLYGHTHEAVVDYVKGRLLLNPGEVAGALNKPSVAVFEVETLKARIIPL